MSHICLFIYDAQKVPSWINKEQLHICNIFSYKRDLFWIDVDCILDDLVSDITNVIRKNVIGLQIFQDTFQYHSKCSLMNCELEWLTLLSILNPAMNWVSKFVWLVRKKFLRRNERHILQLHLIEKKQLPHTKAIPHST